MILEGVGRVDITVKDVEHVASLARLELTEQEKEQFAAQLSAILKYVDQLNELDTSDVDPTSHVLDLYNVMRDDKSRPSPGIDQLMKNAPDVEDDQFRVPDVLE
jgi:aspartyl-tRNA(Asn)/glutamyl-tRNA(Gln) amidotransferase subunit C